MADNKYHTDETCWKYCRVVATCFQVSCSPHEKICKC